MRSASSRSLRISTHELDHSTVTKTASSRRRPWLDAAGERGGLTTGWDIGPPGAARDVLRCRRLPPGFCPYRCRPEYVGPSVPLGPDPPRRWSWRRNPRHLHIDEPIV